jgi:hypothetical protein
LQLAICVQGVLFFLVLNVDAANLRRWKRCWRRLCEGRVLTGGLGATRSTREEMRREYEAQQSAAAVNRPAAAGRKGLARGATLMSINLSEVAGAQFPHAAAGASEAFSARSSRLHMREISLQLLASQCQPGTAAEDATSSGSFLPAGALARKKQKPLHAIADELEPPPSDDSDHPHQQQQQQPAAHERERSEDVALSSVTTTLTVSGARSSPNLAALDMEAAAAAVTGRDAAASVRGMGETRAEPAAAAAASAASATPELFPSSTAEIVRTKSDSFQRLP